MTNINNSNHIKQNIFFKYFLIALLGVSISISLVIAWSNITTIRVEKDLVLFEKKQLPYNQEVIDNYESRLSNSISINPYNAKTYLLLARLLTIKNQNTSIPSNQNILDAAEKNFLLALNLQPTWSLTWASYTEFLSNSYYKDKSNKFISHQDSFDDAIKQTITIGPYERSTQYKVIPIILKHWANIKNSKLTESANVVLQHSLQYNSTKHYTLKQAKKYKQLCVIKPLINEKKLLKTLNYYMKQNGNIEHGC